MLPLIKKDFQIKDQHIGFVSSAVYLGALVGALFWGYWCDKVKFVFF